MGREYREIYRANEKIALSTAFVKKFDIPLIKEGFLNRKKNNHFMK